MEIALVFNPTINGHERRATVGDELKINYDNDKQRAS